MLLVVFKKLLEKKNVDDDSLNSEDSLEAKIIQIQQGDTLLRDRLIADYKPFIAKVASRFCKRYINPDRDDEFSIAMHAFNEAINQFSIGAGGSFLGFAQTVIRRRLIDYVRKEQRHSGNIPLSAFDMEDEENHIINPVETSQAIARFDHEKQADERREEITDLNEELMDYGITFQELVKASPKHADSRELLFTIGKTLASDERLMDMLMTNKKLPIKPLESQVTVSRKTLERNRKYIIALALIHRGKYPHLQEYLEPMGGELTYE